MFLDSRKHGQEIHRLKSYAKQQFMQLSESRWAENGKYMKVPNSHKLTVIHFTHPLSQSFPVRGVGAWWPCWLVGELFNTARKKNWLAAWLFSLLFGWDGWLVRCLVGSCTVCAVGTIGRTRCGNIMQCL